MALLKANAESVDSTIIDVRRMSPLQVKVNTDNHRQVRSRKVSNMHSKDIYEFLMSTQAQILIMTIITIIVE